MGRGRAKAKQQKVARRLKYSGGGTDLDRLAEELGVAGDEPDDDPSAEGPSDDAQADPYAHYVDDEDDRDGSRRL
ncbi:MAG TPA: DUF3073 domain-containing protein [Streptosporangiaceae bacterium]|jgi:hypothetical protein